MLHSYLANGIQCKLRYPEADSKLILIWLKFLAVVYSNIEESRSIQVPRLRVREPDKDAKLPVLHYT